MYEQAYMQHSHTFALSCLRVAKLLVKIVTAHTFLEQKHCQETLNTCAFAASQYQYSNLAGV